jgi:rhodanese-related sulfurtransferase
MTLLRFSALALALSASIAVASEHTRDSLATVKENVARKKAVLVDVREQAEWDEGHLAGAVLLPLSELKKGQPADKLPKDKILYTHCVVGQRAISAGNILEKLGYEVRPLKAGYKQLLEAGFPKAKK